MIIKSDVGYQKILKWLPNIVQWNRSIILVSPYELDRPENVWYRVIYDHYIYRLWNNQGVADKDEKVLEGFDGVGLIVYLQDEKHTELTKLLRKSHGIMILVTKDAQSVKALGAAIHLVLPSWTTIIVYQKFCQEILLQILKIWAESKGLGVKNVVGGSINDIVDIWEEKWQEQIEPFPWYTILRNKKWIWKVKNKRHKKKA